MKDVVIVGAGGLGREVLAIFEAANIKEPRWNVLGFVDANESLKGQTFNGLPILGNDSWCEANTKVEAVCAIGEAQTRKRVAESLAASGTRFATIVHPEVSIPRDVILGAGTIVMAGTRFTSNARIGSHVILYLNCSIPHDVVIEDYCLVACGCALGGGVHLQEGSELGTHASVIPFRTVGSWSTVGAGAVVTEDVPCNVLAAGVPCKVIRKKD